MTKGEIIIYQHCNKEKIETIRTCSDKMLNEESKIFKNKDNLKKAEKVLKKDSTLQMIKIMENRKIIRNCSRQLSKIIKELEKIEAPRKRVIDWLSD